LEMVVLGHFQTKSTHLYIARIKLYVLHSYLQCSMWFSDQKGEMGVGLYHFTSTTLLTKRHLSHHPLNARQ